MKRIAFLIWFTLFLFGVASAQQIAPASPAAKKEALKKAKDAIRLEDEGNTDAAIALLKEASALDPSDLDYTYELGYAYSTKKDYAVALSYLDKLTSRKDVNDLVYELIGNCQSELGHQDRAREIFEEGLKKFPDSGRLLYEEGLLEAGVKQYNRALLFFEKGIEHDPQYPGNYYWAAKLYCHSTEPIWGILYAELFMNLERGTKLTSEMSKLLYDTYLNCIRFNPDSSLQLSFTKFAVSSDSSLHGAKPSFAVSIYEPAIMLAAANEKRIDLEALVRIRKRFVETYYKGQSPVKYPNVLFDFQLETLKAGQLDAYSHWLLMQGEGSTFLSWQSANPEAWEHFADWFKLHPLKLSHTHRFYKAQYGS
jgi:tetratricopeptide (TPR) repeat protein